MKIMDLDKKDNFKYDPKKYIRRYEFTEDEEDILIESLLHYQKTNGFNKNEEKILEYMINTMQDHTSEGNEE